MRHSSFILCILNCQERMSDRGRCLFILWGRKSKEQDSSTWERHRHTCFSSRCEQERCHTAPQLAACPNDLEKIRPSFPESLWKINVLSPVLNVYFTLFFTVTHEVVWIQDVFFKAVKQEVWDVFIGLPVIFLEQCVSYSSLNMGQGTCAAYHFFVGAGWHSCWLCTCSWFWLILWLPSSHRVKPNCMQPKCVCFHQGSEQLRLQTLSYLLVS